MKEKARSLLLQENVDVILGYIRRDGHVLPHYFCKDRIDEVDDLEPGKERYPLEKIAAVLSGKKPALRIGIAARDCTRRALNVLYLWNQLDPGCVETLDVGCCPSPLNDWRECSYMKSENADGKKKVLGLDNRMTPEEAESIGHQDRFERWMYEFGKCLKCYGCRNICPVCFCRECSLEHPELVGTGDLPPAFPIFHLVRAVHMAGRCIDCGLCEEACPVDIPLRLLYSKVNRITADFFGYFPGTDMQPSPFNLLGEEPVLKPRPIITPE